MELRGTSNAIIISARCMDVCVCVMRKIAMPTNVPIQS